jgi:hypothetical protein
VFACRANRNNFCVRRRVIRRGNRIRAFRDDLSVFDDYRREGASSPGMDILERKFNRASHE